VFLGVALLGEAPGANAYAGLAMILSGIALSRLRRRWCNRPPPAHL